MGMWSCELIGQQSRTLVVVVPPVGLLVVSVIGQA